MSQNRRSQDLQARATVSRNSILIATQSLIYFFPVYYRLYAEDGAIQSMNPVYTDDPSLGRIAAELVTPPHTVISLKRCLSGIENIDDNIPTTLFVAASSQTPMDDGVRVSILAYPGPGCTPDEPMAFVAKFSGVGRSSLEATQSEVELSPSPEGPTPFETRYRKSDKGRVEIVHCADQLLLVYYRVYKPRGAVRSKRPAGSNNPFVGRIDVNSFTPPHTATSVMRCISKAEELDNFRQSQLFTSISSESPIGDGHVSILTSDHPGSTSDDPVAFVEFTFTKRIRATRAVGQLKFE